MTTVATPVGTMQSFDQSHHMPFKLGQISTVLPYFCFQHWSHLPLTTPPKAGHASHFFCPIRRLRGPICAAQTFEMTTVGPMQYPN